MAKVPRAIPCSASTLEGQANCTSVGLFVSIGTVRILVGTAGTAFKWAASGVRHVPTSANPRSKSGARSRTRTCNLGIKSPLL